MSTERTNPNNAELCNGSTSDSDSLCLGSNPSSATKKTITKSNRLFFMLSQKSETAIFL